MMSEALRLPVPSDKNKSFTRQLPLLKTMKNKLIHTCLLIAILVLPLLNLAQEPPHPNMGNKPNEGGTVNSPVGGGASLENGTGILLAMGVALGMLRSRKQQHKY